MANAATAAKRGRQTELDLGAVRPGTRPLTFLAAPNGQHFIAIFGGHLYEMRGFAFRDQCCWRASVCRLNGLERVICVLAPTLGDADDLLQAMALELGGAS